MERRRTWLLGVSGASLGFIMAWFIVRLLPIIVVSQTERISHANTLTLKRQLHAYSNQIRQEAEREWELEQKLARDQEVQELLKREINDEEIEGEDCPLDGSACDQGQENQPENLVIPIEENYVPTHCRGPTCPG